MNLNIASKTALVTASSKGLGKAAAVSLAREGANVVISARNAEVLEKTAAEIAELGGNVHHIVCDVTELESPKFLVEETINRFGGIDILVGNAGGPPPMRALDVDEESVLAAINNNLQTSIRLVQAAVPHMQQSNWGRICLITGDSIKQPNPSLALSGMARTGLWSWAKLAAQDLFESGVTLNLICPGLHETDRVKQLYSNGAPYDRPVGDPADFGDVIAFLCSEQAKFISGTAVSVDGATVKGLL